MNKITKKIGIISDTFLPQIGGGEIHVRNLARFLMNEGFFVEIFTNTDGNEEDNGISIIRSVCHGRGIFCVVSDIKNLFRFIIRFGVIHSHYTFYLSFLSSIIAKICHRRFVVTLHGLGTLDSSVNKKFRRRIYRYIAFKFADMVIATSDEMATVARRFVPEEKIVVIPNGVDTKEFKREEKRSSATEIFVLSMRRLNPKNGVQYLIEAAPRIIGEVPNIRFLIAGKDKLENYLKKRVSDLGIGDFVEFIGEVNNEDTIVFYRKADIVVFPSSAESTSIACLESMSMGKAVIASALEVFQEMIGNGRGVLVHLFDRQTSDYDAPLTLPDEKIKALADAVIVLAKDSDLRMKVGDNAHNFVKAQYDWRVLIKKISATYLQ